LVLELSWFLICGYRFHFIALVLGNLISLDESCLLVKLEPEIEKQPELNLVLMFGLVLHRVFILACLFPLVGGFCEPTQKEKTTTVKVKKQQ